MDIDLSTPVVDDLTVQPDAARSAEPKPAWHAPTLTRIDIKRTMFGGGSPIDGGTVAPGTGPG